MWVTRWKVSYSDMLAILVLPLMIWSSSLISSATSLSADWIGVGTGDWDYLNASDRQDFPSPCTYLYCPNCDLYCYFVKGLPSRGASRSKGPGGGQGGASAHRYWHRCHENQRCARGRRVLRSGTDVSVPDYDHFGDCHQKHNLQT